MGKPPFTESFSPLSAEQADRMIARLRETTVGIDVEYLLASGETSRRIYLDSTASTLQLGVVQEVMRRYLPYYANTHSDVHFNAKLSTREFDWAHQMVLNFVEADPQSYGSFFVGSGATAGINRIAATLSRKYPERDVVITTIMEHHSNDLPHRKHFNEVVHIPVQVSDKGLGAVDVDAIARALEKHAGRVNYVAVTGVSNVTGIINPIHDIAELAHQHGAFILVDAAQMAAHMPVKMSGHDNPARNLDMLAMSGHKLYTPASPGVVVTRLDLFHDVEPEVLGGGMVDDVYPDRYEPILSFPDREEAGTPNIAGAIALASVLYTLKRIGMHHVFREEQALVDYAIDQLGQVEDVVIYGQNDTTDCRRTGAVSVNIRGMHHSLSAAILNDYHNIAVRNACFCAHPYVREMISDDLMEHMDSDASNEELEALAEMHRGMVRASFGIYNTPADVDHLVAALRDIVAKREFYEQHYQQGEDGDYVHKTFAFDSTPVFSIKHTVDDWIVG